MSRPGAILDVVVIGGGPAGLNAALLLGRCRRSVLVLDAGRPRNERSRWVGGFLSRDGTVPAELRRLGREELARYPSVMLRDGCEVTSARAQGGGFEIVIGGQERVRSRKLILATGLMDDVPDFPGAAAFHGRGVYPCPYCDGWEHRDEPILAYGRGRQGRGMALELTPWSDAVTLLTDGPSELPVAERDELAGCGIDVVEDRIAALEGDPDGAGLERVRLESGLVLERRALFYAFDGCRTSPLVTELGCELSDTGAVETGHCERTNVPGLYVAGDASRRVKFAIVAAAEGAMAAFGVNTELLKETVRAAREETAA